jgi:prepilin-type processing-associated H-X9-DG protein
MLGLALRTFANASDGEIYPQLSSEPGRLFFDNDALARPVYPDFLSDVSLMVCPADDALVFGSENVDVALDDHSYFYLGYLVNDDKTVESFAEAYRSYLAQGLPFEDSLKVPVGAGILGRDTIPRLREGVERYLITDLPASVAAARSRVQVLIERPEHHSPPGGNVLYMDGHVEFKPYPGEWPMTERTMSILESLDQM